MTTVDLSNVDAGFSDLALGSQTVFKAALQALSHPGRRVNVVHDAMPPSPGHGSSAALVLALADAESCVWLSASVAGGNAGPWLRFHTGCSLVEDPGAAHFAWASHLSELPELEQFSQGSLRYPDRSALCLIDVESLDVPSDASPVPVGVSRSFRNFILRGPGIVEQAQLRVGGWSQPLTERFSQEMAANHARFPCGVDVFLATPAELVGLPRTTFVQLEA
jgi:alpha-D-ribose 1-methylphosphonate 5-triphosphate synthase subunit PhnH